MSRSSLKIHIDKLEHRSLKNNDVSKKKKKVHRLNPISKKEAKNKRNLAKAYAEIDETVEKVCSGCGQLPFLSRAHLISQRNKKHQSNPKNIVYDCMERITPDIFGNLGCHQRWESGQWNKIITLANAQQRLDFIKENDIVKYRKILLTKK